MNSFSTSIQIKSNSCFIDQAAKSVSQFQIYSLEWIQQNIRLGATKADRAKSFEIIWFKKGTGVLTIDLKDISISENSIYVIAPCQYRLFHCDQGAEGYYMSLSEEYLYLTESHVDFALLIEQSKGDNNRQVIQADAGMEDLIVRIHNEYNNQNSLRTEILKSMLKVFLIYLSRMMEQGRTGENGLTLDKEVGFVRKFMQLLKKHFATKKLVADYADELCITPNYLNFLVKKQTGFPVSHHIQQYIIMEAKRQALYSGMRMKEVADALGFEDYAHFSKFFKNYSGVNFSSFRKGVLGNNF